MSFEFRAKDVFLLSSIFSILAATCGSGIVFFLLSQKEVLLPSSEENTTQNITASTSLVNLEGSVKNISKTVGESVVSIIISKEVTTYKSDPWGFFYEPSGTVKKQVGGGTGFFITKDGYIITNHHVASDANADYSIILADGTELVGKIVGVDSTNDIAIMRAYLADKQTPYTASKPVEFVSKVSDIETGGVVVAIGNALAQFQNTLTLGVVSGLGRSIEASDQSSGSSEQLTGLIQTDAAINSGNSGGPLISISGKVIGMNTAVTQGANGIGFAIPLSEKIVKNLLNSAITYGAIKRPMIGMRYVMLTSQTAKELKLSVTNGAYVYTSNGIDAVVKWSAAEEIGLAAWDVILEIDGNALTAQYTPREAIAEKAPGENVSLKILKSSGETVMKTLKLGMN